MVSHTRGDFLCLDLALISLGQCVCVYLPHAVSAVKYSYLHIQVCFETRKAVFLHSTLCVCVCVCVCVLYCRYGFDYGSAHFVLMSTEHFFDPTSPQYKFLDEHLKAVDRTRTPWLIFAGHRSL